MNELTIFWTQNSRGYHYLWINDNRWQAVISHEPPSEFGSNEFGINSFNFQEISENEQSNSFHAFRKLRWFEHTDKKQDFNKLRWFEHTSFHYAWFEQGVFRTCVSNEKVLEFVEHQFPTVDVELIKIH